MNELLGLIDAMEALILDGGKVPFSEKVMVEEKRLLQVIDKMRLVIKSDGDIVKNTVDVSRQPGMDMPELEPTLAEDDTFNAELREPDVSQQRIDEAIERSKEIKKGANDYADYVMSNLQLLVTKVQSNVVKMEKTLTQSREMIEKIKEDDEKESL